MEDSAQRRYPRREINRPVGVLHQGGYHVGRVQEISEGGLLLATNLPIQVGDEFVVTLRTFKTAWVSTRVKTLYNKTPNTFGVEFLDLHFQARRHIRNLVASMSQRADQQNLIN